MRISMDTCVSYVENNLHLVPIPDWTHLNVISKDTIVIPFDQIYIDDIHGNNAKVETHNGEEIELLKNSFAEGVDLKEFPPAVIYRGPQYEKPYVLIYGYGRVEAIQLNKQKSWYFTLLEGDTDALEDVQAAENEALPKRINKEVDMRKFLINKVKEGKIGNTEKDIRAKFRKVYANRDKSVMNRVVQQVMEAVKTPVEFNLYTSVPRVKQWLTNHATESYAIEGEFDTARGMFGVLCKGGYQYRTVIAAFERYEETGKYTYVMGHFDAPSPNTSLTQKRKHFVKEFESIRKALENCGLKTWPIVIQGFLPQDVENENIKKLIRVEELI